MHDKQCDKHYKCLIRVISTLKCVTRQGLAIRQNDEIEGNFNQLLLARSEDYAPLSS